jgi:hypothetical protein
VNKRDVLTQEKGESNSRSKSLLEVLGVSTKLGLTSFCHSGIAYGEARISKVHLQA